MDRPDRQAARTTRRLTIALLVAPIAAGLSLLPATVRAQASWADTLTQARKEATVVMYASPVVPLLERIKQGFQKAYPGMTLEYTRIGDSSLIPTKIDAERAAGIDGADVIIGTELTVKIWLDKLAVEGAFAKPRGPDAARFPSRYALRNGTTPLLGMEPFTMAYNTELVKQPIKTYADLLRPDLKGKLGASEVSSATMASWYAWLERNNGPDYLEKLAAQKPKIYTGGVPSAQSVAAGENWVAAFATMTTMRDLVKQGAPVAIVVPTPSFGTAYTGAILGWSKHPAAAQVFLNWLVSVDGQTVMNGAGDSASPLPGIPGALNADTVNFEFPPMTNEQVTALKTRFMGLLAAQK